MTTISFLGYQVNGRREAGPGNPIYFNKDCLLAIYMIISLLHEVEWPFNATTPGMHLQGDGLLFRKNFGGDVLLTVATHH